MCLLRLSLLHKDMKKAAPYVAMVVVVLAYGGSNILMKIALEKGLNQLVFIVYRHIIAVLLLSPFAYILERNQRPPLSLRILVKIFLLSSFGTTLHLNVYYAGLAYTSPTVASALSNVIPCLTFLLAILLGMEKANIKSINTQAKVVGTVVCIAGSLTFTFWKGGYLMKSFTKRPLIDIYAAHGSAAVVRHGNENWLKGSGLILISYIAWSAWLIFQGMIVKDYPARLSLNTWICFFASVQSSILAMFFGRTPSLWKLAWDVQLLTIVYCGVVISALVYYLQIWCISHKGPLFAATFSPLLLVVVAIFSATAFAEQLHLGSLVGAGIIILGLYCVLWGKKKESHMVTKQPLNEKDVPNNMTPETSVNIRQ